MSVQSQRSQEVVEHVYIAVDVIWLPVRGWEGIYSISNYGQVRCEVDRRGQPAGSLLKLSPDPKGYLKVNLRDRFRHKNALVHVLVVESFVGLIPKGMQVNHQFGEKADNFIGRLEITTPQGNVLHAMHVLGKIPTAKINLLEVVELRERIAAGEPEPMLAIEFGLSRITVNQIATGRKWASVGGPLRMKHNCARRS